MPGAPQDGRFLERAKQYRKLLFSRFGTMVLEVASHVGKPRKVDSPKKKRVEKPQDGHQKSSQNIGNPYQMEDNKNPKGAARSAAPLGRRRRRRLVVFHLIRISYVLA